MNRSPIEWCDFTQTGTRVVMPDPQWIHKLDNQCAGVPVFVKDNIGPSWAVQEFPADLQRIREGRNL